MFVKSLYKYDEICNVTNQLHIHHSLSSSTTEENQYHPPPPTF